MHRRDEFGKMEVWHGGQIALYANDNSYILLAPITDDQDDECLLVAFEAGLS